MKRKGFTLIGVLIVIVVIGVLAAMMMLSSTEAISTAKAAKILANLQTLKRAAELWYADNREKITVDGRVKIGNTTHSIHEWYDKDIHLSRYIDNIEKAGIFLHKKSYTDPNTGNGITELEKGSYGLYDGGTFKEKNAQDKWVQTEFHRNSWYVGYRFKDDEDKVREKIRGRMKSAGVFFGTADVHKDTYYDNNMVVWLKVF